MITAVIYCDPSFGSSLIYSISVTEEAGALQIIIIIFKFLLIRAETCWYIDFDSNIRYVPVSSTGVQIELINPCHEFT